ncbi:GNAT family N-acetyltransferase [Chitinimonas lacunae]|uniref:GNAT family N-acetyltransferase n=1 Tax=Chitinimonas lacunae TaxID=1963018 RepID=A0ABV8MLL2_9NEIS
MNLQWRHFTAADAASVSELFRAVYGEHYVYPDLYLPAMISQHNAQGDWYSALALDGERVVGHSALCRDPQDPGSAELALNAVHPDARGRGIATTLGQLLCGHARELGLDTLTIKQVSSYTHSQQLARTLGFQTTGLLLDYVSSPYGNAWRESVVLGCQTLRPGHRPLPALDWPAEYAQWAESLTRHFGSGSAAPAPLDTPMQVRRHGERVEVTLERVEAASLAQIALLPGNWLIHVRLRLDQGFDEALARLAPAGYVFAGLAPAPGAGWYALLERGFDARPLTLRCPIAQTLHQNAQLPPLSGLPPRRRPEVGAAAIRSC